MAELAMMDGPDWADEGYGLLLTQRFEMMSGLYAMDIPF
jgi:hypothetical protein